MDEVARIGVMVSIVGVAAIGAYLARRRQAPTRAIGSEHGPFPNVFFFGSDTCQSCAPALAVLRDSALEFRHYTWEKNQDVFEEWNIEEVPLLWVLDSQGRIRTQITGVPGRRRLAQAKLQT